MNSTSSRTRPRRSILSPVGLVLIIGASSVIACSKDDDDPALDGEMDTATGGTFNGSGGRQGQTLDHDALAANCKGMTVAANEECSQSELVCPTTLGTLCICGGVPPETGQDRDPPDDDGRGNWWDDDPDDDPPPTSRDEPQGGNGSSSDLVWVCFTIGPPHVDDGEGGQLNQGGEGGAP